MMAAGPTRTRGGNVAVTEHTTGGDMSLGELAAANHADPSTILRLTAENTPEHVYPPNVSDYINGVFDGKITYKDHMPKGLHLYLP
jgi:hypothetical protein